MREREAGSERERERVSEREIEPSATNEPMTFVFHDVMLNLSREKNKQ